MKIRLAVIFSILTLISIAQNKKSFLISKFQEGDVTIQEYESNIFKLTFHNKSYNTNENFTHAVILKPKPIINTTLVNNADEYLSFDKSAKAKLLHVFKNAKDCGFEFDLDDDEMIFGGGERALPLNRRGYLLNLYNNPWYGYSEGADNLNFSVPFFVSSKGYALFFDNGSNGYADIDKSKKNKLKVGFVSGEINVYVILGNNYKDILTSYHKLTGTQPLPPRWALGNFVSRFGYTSTNQVNEIASAMSNAHIPFDAVIFDLFWFGDSIQKTLGNLDWINKTKWPNPPAMLAGFKQRNIHPILITEPFFLQNTKQYNASKPYLAVDSLGKPYIIPDFYFGVGGLLDVFRKDAGDWIWNTHYKKQIANGVDAWWTDLGEPEKHPNNVLHNLRDEGFKRLFKASELHNIYGHYWNKMLFEHYAKDFPDKRLFHLNRSGFPGSQRFSIFPWSGDVSRSWSGLTAQFDVMLGMSMCGIPYIHADAGGFAGGDGDMELYIRWLQFASYTPIFRPHGTALFEVDPNAFSFPSEPALMPEPYKSIAKKIVCNRYQLMPYTYTLAYEQTVHAKPLVSPLYYQFPEDKNAITSEDEFTFGEQLLIAPIHEKNKIERSVYFPAGIDWYTLKTNELTKGGITQNIKASLDDIPVFVKSGSIIPYAANTNFSTTKDLHDDSLRLDYYASDSATKSIIYFDDGESKNALASKQFEIITIQAQKKNSVYIIDISSNAGKYIGKPAVRNFEFKMYGIKKEITSVTINKVLQPKTKVNAHIFFFNYAGKPLHIEVK